MFRSFLLVVSVLVGVLFGCAERALDDELAEYCKNACHRGRQCGRVTDGRDQDACVEACIPAIQKSRAACDVVFDLLVCLSDISCADYSEYERVLGEKDVAT